MTGIDEHDEVDQERKHPPGQHAAKQFRLGTGSKAWGCTPPSLRQAPPALDAPPAL